MQELVALLRMRCEISVNVSLLYGSRIDVLSRFNTVDGQEGLALVFERRGNRSLVQTIKCQQILGSRSGSQTLVELNEIAIGAARFGMALLFVKRLKCLSDF